VTEITTKELFELAKISYNEGFNHFPADDAVDWDDLPPIDQAVMAEGIRKVVEELERRGWSANAYGERYTPTAVDGNPLENFDNVLDPTQWFADAANMHIDQDILTGTYRRWLAGEPAPFRHGEARCRVSADDAIAKAYADSDSWNRWEDVPVGVTVESTKGFHITKVAGYNENYDIAGPFVRVDETEYKEEGYEWSHWEDVPEGVVYKNSKPLHRARYVNRDGVRILLKLDGSEVVSEVSDDHVQAFAPFIRVEG